MRLEVELQYAEFHPNQVEKVGQVELNQALKIIHSYPWDREFEKIEERTKKDLTSTIPSVSIINKEKEILIVSARDKDSFIVHFQNSSHHAELIVANNSFNNKQGFSTEDIVTEFFEGTIKNSLKLKALAPKGIDNVSVYKLREYPLVISILTFVVLALILIIDFSSNG